jgi:hypothetical protein
MHYTTRSRDRWKAALALLTGLASFGTVTAVGAATGLAARQTGLRDQHRAAEQAYQQAQARAAALRRAQWQPASRVIEVTRTRPHRTVVLTRVVHVASAPGVAVAGPNPAVSAPVHYAAPSTGGGTTTSSSTVPAPPPPPPPPPPAPSSGSHP